jgi:hypothetical protein
MNLYSIPLIGFQHSSNYQDHDYSSFPSSISTNIHPKAACFTELLKRRNIEDEKFSDDEEADEMRKTITCKALVDGEAWTVITDDYLSPSSEYISTLFLQSSTSSLSTTAIPFLTFDTYSFINKDTIEKCLKKKETSSSSISRTLSLFPSSSNPMLYPTRSDNDNVVSYEEFQELFHKIEDIEFNDAKYRLTNIQIDNGKIKQIQVSYSQCRCFLLYFFFLHSPCRKKLNIIVKTC